MGKLDDRIWTETHIMPVDIDGRTKALSIPRNVRIIEREFMKKKDKQGNMRTMAIIYRLEYRVVVKKW